jgi:hypothetical protein
MDLSTLVQININSSADNTEEQNRAKATRTGYYAESGPRYDPSGKYLCGTCNGRMRTNKCSRVHGTISFTTGSCKTYKIGRVATKKESVILSQKDAIYTERPNDKTFGCHRCQYGVKAAEPDGKRTLDCKEWNCLVLPTACCEKNKGKDDVYPWKSKIEAWADRKLDKALVHYLNYGIKAGGPGSGRRPSGRKPKVKKEKNLLKQQRALSSYVPSNKASQLKAEANEKKLVKALGSAAQHIGDHAPFDVMLPGHRIGIEVKTKNEGRKDSITMHPSSLRRKLDAAKTMRLSATYTVIFDDRHNKIYYANQLGSFNWRYGMNREGYRGALKEAKDIKDLRKIILGK